VKRLLIHALLWIGDQFDRGVPLDLDFNPFETLCYHVSQSLYRLAWMLMEAPAK